MLGLLNKYKFIGANNTLILKCFIHCFFMNSILAVLGSCHWDAGGELLLGNERKDSFILPSVFTLGIHV